MVYMYIVKHNSILGGRFTSTKAQLHVSAINVGHLQVAHEKLINKLYQRVWGVYRLWEGYSLLDKFLMYNLKMANIDGRNM